MFHAHKELLYSWGDKNKYTQVRVKCIIMVIMVYPIHCNRRVL